MKYFAPIFMFSLPVLVAQNVPKEPAIPLPENGFYHFLDDPKISDARKLDGKPLEVLKTVVHFNDFERIAYSEVLRTTLTKEGEIKTFSRQASVGEGNYEPFEKPEPAVAIDSIDGYKRVQLKQDGEDGKVYFLYRDDALVKTVIDTDEYLEKEFKYDESGQVSEIRTYRRPVVYDENDEHETRDIGERQNIGVMMFYYDSLERMECKERHLLWHETVKVFRTNYEYNDRGELIKFSNHYNKFIADNVDLVTPIDEHEFEAYDMVEGEETIGNGSFEYDSNGDPRFYELEDTKGNFERFTVLKSDRKMVVNGDFRSQQENESIDKKVRYEYDYDEFKNPIRILSYQWDGDVKRLKKKTTIDIAFKLKKEEVLLPKNETKQQRKRRLRKARRAVRKNPANL